jgi:hypothetical protein
VTSFVPTPNQSQIFIALRSFLIGVLPPGVSVIQGQVNRVPEPAGVDYVVAWPLRSTRLKTNEDAYADCAFTASIAGTTMTVTGVLLGTITVGNQLFGTGLAGATGPVVVAGQLTGTGGVGTYSVSPVTNLPSQLLAAGQENLLQASELVIQLDVHGPNAMDNAVTITTLFRDDYGYQTLTAANVNVAPLYADDPKQVPFINDQNAYEDRWIVEAHLQVNQTISLAQQFAAALQFTLVEVP